MISENLVVAKLCGCRMSAQKVRLVVDMVRGLRVEAALNTLAFCNKAAAPVVAKVIRSAMNNAEHNNDLDVDSLVVARIFVDEGSRYKRMHARAKGRGNKITKPTCHITVKVAENH